MKIGVDLDNTICNTSDLVNKYAQEYALTKKINFDDIFEDEKIKEDFFFKYTTDIFTKVSIKDNASEVINRLREKGCKIYVITARSNYFIAKEIDVLEPTSNWLIKNNIVVDKIITNCYGPTKAIACRDNNIDLMIDDDLYNCQMVNKLGVKYLLFDEKNRYNESNKVTNWLEVEKNIEGNE